MCTRACNFLKALNRANKCIIKNNQSHPSPRHLASAIDPLSTRIYTSVNKNSLLDVAKMHLLTGVLEIESISVLCASGLFASRRGADQGRRLQHSSRMHPPCDQTLTRDEREHRPLICAAVAPMNY